MILDQDGRRLMEVRGSRHSLIIRNVQPSDYANYSCEADNKLGRNRKHIELSGEFSIICICDFVVAVNEVNRLL